MADPQRHKPGYSDPAGDPRRGALPVTPPFVMSGVSSRVFPLKANMARLTQFCDQYLNMDIPPGIVHYRPAAPFVYLMVLDYGSMSSASVAAQNVGWVAQHELAFTVPLQRWREEHGRMVFKGWACVSPFIFVDDAMSLTTGREVYGWPKVAGTVDAEIPLWDHHPRAATRLFTFSTAVFPKVYAGEPESARVLLQIDVDPSPSLAMLPPDAANPWYPTQALATAARSSMLLAGTALDMALGLRLRGYRTQRDAASLLAMGRQALGYFRQMLPARLGPNGPVPRNAASRADAGVNGQPGMSFENLTVKQFRDAEQPDRACYKAIVTSTMTIDRLNQSGLLGDVNLLRGDVSGGYTLRVHRYASQPIIESLGLEVAGTEEQQDGGLVSLLKPMFPFWTDVDLLYGAGRALCSRTPGENGDASTAWVDEQRDAQLQRVRSPAATSARHEEAFNLYNTALGAATQPVAGPFEFPDVTLQVYPLMADAAQLGRYLDQYLNTTLDGTGLRFEAFGTYVYMVVSITGDQHGTMWSSSNNIGWWAEREVSFCIPVKWYRGDELVSVALVAPFVYANNGRAVITDREVNGRPSIEASIDSPADVWLESSGPDQGRRFLHMDTEAFPALHLGQKGQRCTLLEIDENDILPYNDDVGWRMVAEGWGEAMADDLKRRTEERAEKAGAVRDVQALALELLAHGAPINWINLKQYRDAADVSRACYQAAVRITRSITRIYDIREIERRVHLRLHRLSGHPIAEALGLKVKSVDSRNGQVVDNLQPMRPFWMRVSLKEDLGQVLAWRATAEQWHVPHPWFAAPGAPAAQAAAAGGGGGGGNAADLTGPSLRGDGVTRVGAALAAPDLVWWQRLREHADAWLRSALGAELARLVPALWALPAPQQQAVADGLPAAARDDLARLATSPDLAVFADATPIDALRALADALRTPLGTAPLAGLAGAGPGEPGDPGLSRLTVPEARAAVASLSELQLAVEAVLSAEWENWGNPRRYRGLPPKPEQCVRAGSVYGGSAILQPYLEGFIADHGLAVTDDGADWFVAPATAEAPTEAPTPAPPPPRPRRRRAPKA